MYKKVPYTFSFILIVKHRNCVNIVNKDDNMCVMLLIYDKYVVSQQHVRRNKRKTNLFKETIKDFFIHFI